MRLHACIGREAVLASYRKDDEVNIEHVDSSVVEDVCVDGDLAVARGTDTGATTPRRGGGPDKLDGLMRSPGFEAKSTRAKTKAGS